MNEEVRALIDYRMEEARDALEEATILLLLFSIGNSSRRVSFR
jgi:hypothetical protein